MSETPISLAPHTSPTEEAVRESRHQVLRELLGAYADRELPPETVAQIDAHLIGCERCRRELDVHDAIRGRLATVPLVAASPSLRERISAALDAVPAPEVAVQQPVDQIATERRITWLAAAGWVIALVLTLVLATRIDVVRPTSAATTEIGAPVRSVPLLNGILQDYARVSEGDLPGRARDLSTVRAALSFPIEPLRAPNLRLLAAWTADIRGEPAAVLAYRLDDRLVVQYIVAEDAFFRHQAIRSAVADRHLLTATDGAKSIVAWPEPATGTVLVGNVPAPSLRDIWLTERAR
jgi:anti-sigma factor RsiW